MNLRRSRNEGVRRSCLEGLRWRLKLQRRQKGVGLGELDKRFGWHVRPPDVVNSFEILVHASRDDPGEIGDG